MVYLTLEIPYLRDIREYHILKEEAMANIEGLSKEEIKELIQEHLKELDVDFDSIDVDIVDGPKVVLSGKVESRGEREMIEEVLMDIVGLDDIVDELVIIDGGTVENDDKDLYDDEDVYDEDDDSMGTENAFQSIEEGIPYTPPTSPSYKESPGFSKRKKNRQSGSKTYIA